MFKKCLTVSFFSVSLSANPSLADEVKLPVSELSELTPVCNDHLGTPVTYLTGDEAIGINPMVINIGARYIDPDAIEYPAIVYSLNFLNSNLSIWRDFVIAHECYHFSSGDAHRIYEDRNASGEFLGRSKMLDLENDADCAAAIKLKDYYGYSATDMSQLYNYMRLNYKKRNIQERLENIESCYSAP